MPTLHDPFDETLLPFEVDAHDPRAPRKPSPAVLSEAFAYDGRGLSLEQFQAFVQTYDFGKIPPDSVCFHHTANPDATWAPLSANLQTKWDRNEGGLSIEAIRVKRKRQLDAIRTYYATALGWTAGPHLFIDDHFIWLFTPMYDVGIHAKWGNSFRAFQKLHYSIGIEVIGYYERTPWPPKVAALVGGAVRALHARLGTFSLDYLYPTPQSKPGMKLIKVKGSPTPQQACAFPERLRFGGLFSHRDTNKPECPGAAITEAFYLKVCRGV